jgi:hypothetical protein
MYHNTVFVQNGTAPALPAPAEAISDGLNPIIQDSDDIMSHFGAFTLKTAYILAKLLGFTRIILV